MEELKNNYNRREFLKRSTAGALYLFFASLFGKNNKKEKSNIIVEYNKIYQNLLDFGIRSNIDTEIVNKEAIEFIKKVYNVEVFESLKAGTEASVLKDFKYTVIENLDVTVPDKNQICIMLKVIFREIVKYPKDYFIKNKIERFILVTDLKRKNKSIGGLALNNLGEAIISFGYDGSGVDSIFHHELYHLADWNDGGFGKDDEKWKEIHNCDCDPYSLDSLNNEDILNSFMTDYSQKQPTEDRAVIAGFLMTKGIYYLEDSLENNPTKGGFNILLQKINEIKKDYLKFSQGRMDDDFFNTINQEKSCPEYFL